MESDRNAKMKTSDNTHPDGILRLKSFKLLIGAIDFGTTYSGYAFSFRHDYEMTPLKINTNHWENFGSGGIQLKIPTCILLTPDKKFHSFGYDAKDKYQELADDDEHGTWYFFHHFKMTLHQEEEISGSYLLKEEGGKELDAMTVFSMSIRYMKDHLLNKAQNAAAGLVEDDITWVITVPAIWKESAKKFMRKAAEKAGIAKEKIEIALEPEAASIYCRHLPVARCPESETGVMKLGHGSQYMVADCGGGTVDVTVHEILENNNIRELHVASGGNWGGANVNKAFLSSMASLVGQDVFDKFSESHKGDYLAFRDEFERKKRAIKKPDSMDGEGCNDYVTVNLPASLLRTYKEVKKNKFTQDELNSDDKEKFKIMSKNKIKIKSNVFREYFDKTFNGLVKHIKVVLGHLPKLPKAILMVGGFSESQLLQSVIRKNFEEQMEVIIPTDASLCIMKGAVLYGHNPQLIKFRQNPYTYGVAITTKFDLFHKKEKKFTMDGKDFCDDVFDVHVTVDQEIQTGVPQAKKTYYPITDTSKVYPIVLYRSIKPRPMYVDEEGCSRVGTFHVESGAGLGKSGKERPIMVKMIFGGTDITVTATDIDGNEHTADFSFG